MRRHPASSIDIFFHEAGLNCFHMIGEEEKCERKPAFLHLAQVVPSMELDIWIIIFRLGILVHVGSGEITTGT